MARRTTADLPLHSGAAPGWLFDRMVDLSEVVAEAVIEEHDRSIEHVREILEGAELDGETKQSSLRRLAELE